VRRDVSIGTSVEKCLYALYLLFTAVVVMGPPIRTGTTVPDCTDWMKSKAYSHSPRTSTYRDILETKKKPVTTDEDR
jgi:hypothetical protein